MMEETTPRNSASWVPTTTFAGEAGISSGGKYATDDHNEQMAVDDMATGNSLEHRQTQV